MRLIRPGGALALALTLCAPVAAQETIAVPAGFVPKSVGSYDDGTGHAASVSKANPLPIAPGAPLPSQATPLTGSVTATAATPTSGTCAFASGTATCGPFAAQLGLPVFLLLKGGAAMTAYLGSTTTSDCSTVNQLTAGGSPVAYTASVDEAVIVPPTTGNVKYCLVLTVSSGTETYAVRQ